MKTILITGAAGFIGSHVARYFNNTKDWNVLLVDNLNSYYDVNLKKDRIKHLDSEHFITMDINDKSKLKDIFNNHNIDVVVNLAAQAGVRYAKENPETYMHSNVDGFFNLIDLAAKHNVKKFLYASSSSVYGSNSSMPFKETDPITTPMSLYAATKVADEAIASSYFYTYNLQTIGMRFFNVYGPWGRPDMAYFKWTQALLEGAKIELRENGEMWRDMTYIDDVVTSIAKLVDTDLATAAPYVLNIGNQDPVKISDVLEVLSDELRIAPKIESVPRGDEEPVKTWADTSILNNLINYTPQTDYRDGLKVFLEWYMSYYKNTSH